ncbi:MAG: NnrU family protein [Gammaproteobacteria bacterium]|jgi:uncharacterized membrane protein|nr:NnrU family protein [Gammaproteobacteria bacterium]
MTLLILGLVLFLGTHSVSIISWRGRDALVARMGEIPFKAAYGLLAIAGLVLIVIGYGQARMDPTWLWQPPAFMRHIAMLLMLFAFPALLAAYFPGRIQRTLKHPMLVAVKAWALAHLLVNGTLADLLLFGGFLAWAVVDRISFKRRPQRATPQLPDSRANDAIVIVGGLALYAAFAFWLHPILFGVPVMS